MTIHAAWVHQAARINLYSGGLAVAGAAADARKTSGTAGHATRARELPAGATADTRDTALATGATAGPIELSAGAAGCRWRHSRRHPGPA